MITMCVQVVKGCLGFSSLSDKIKNPKIRLLIGSLEILMNCCLLYFLFCFFLERPTASWGGGNVCFPAKRNTLDISFYFLFVFFSLSFPFSFEKLIVLICSSPMTWLRAESDHSSMRIPRPLSSCDDCPETASRGHDKQITVLCLWYLDVDIAGSGNPLNAADFCITLQY